jgi:hypothetical protein
MRAGTSKGGTISLQAAVQPRSMPRALVVKKEKKKSVSEL